MVFSSSCSSTHRTHSRDKELELRYRSGQDDCVLLLEVVVDVEVVVVVDVVVVVVVGDIVGCKHCLPWYFCSLHQRLQSKSALSWSL